MQGAGYSTIDRSLVDLHAGVGESLPLQNSMHYWTYKLVAPSTYLCREKFYIETANIFVITHKGHAVLIDTGTGCAPLLEISKVLKVTFDACFITHAHFDHFSGAQQLSCPVFVSASLKNVMLRRNSFGLHFFSLADVLGGARVKLHYANCIPRFASLQKNVRATTIAPMTFTWNGYNFMTFSLPGHTPDSMGVFCEPLHGFFTGDALYNGTPYFSFQNSSVKQGIESLKLIERVKPTYIFPGHNDVLGEVAGARVLKQWREVLST